MREEFNLAFSFGRIGEQVIARFLMERGWCILPVYEAELDDRDKVGCGPRIFGDGMKLIAPDFLTFKMKNMLWVEAKRKTHFAWYRKEQCWTTGIDRRCFDDYLGIRRRFDFPLWVLFLHESAEPSAEDRRRECPAECPTGLFGQEIEKLADEGKTRSFRNRRMIYWPVCELWRIASLENFRRGRTEREITADAEKAACSL